MWVWGADTFGLCDPHIPFFFSLSHTYTHFRFEHYRDTSWKWNEAMPKRNANRMKVPMRFYTYITSNTALTCLPALCAQALMHAFDPIAQYAFKATMYDNHMVGMFSSVFLEILKNSREDPWVAVIHTPTIFCSSFSFSYPSSSSSFSTSLSFHLRH